MRQANALHSDDEYWIPAAAVTSELKVKGSKFIAHIEATASDTAAEEHCLRWRKRHHDATHNCFAYRINDAAFRYSDDGEPSGTAGKPIFQALVGAGLYEALAVVTRYFGGTKLGTGGLARAYADAVKSAIENLTFKKKTVTVPYRLQFGYELEPIVRHCIDDFKGKILDSRYSEDVSLSIAVPRSMSDHFRATLTDRTHSAVHIGD